MTMALHIIAITMKRIPIATAMDRVRKNGDRFSPHVFVANVGLFFCDGIEVSQFANSDL